MRPVAQNTPVTVAHGPDVDPFAALGSKLSRPVARHTAIWTIGVAALLFTFLGQLAC